MTEPSTLSVMLRAIDLKNRDYWDNLTDEQKKKHSNYLALRWASSVNGNQDLAKYYVLSTNQQVNKNFWSLNKHPKLQWLLTTCISPGMGGHRHEWIAFKGKSAKNKKAQLIANLNPTMKMDEAEHLSILITDIELTAHLKDLGWEDKKIREALKGKGDDD